MSDFSLAYVLTTLLTTVPLGLHLGLRKWDLAQEQGRKREDLASRVRPAAEFFWARSGPSTGSHTPGSAMAAGSRSAGFQ